MALSTGIYGDWLKKMDDSPIVQIVAKRGEWIETDGMPQCLDPSHNGFIQRRTLVWWWWWWLNNEASIFFNWMKFTSLFRKSELASGIVSTKTIFHQKYFECFKASQSRVREQGKVSVIFSLWKSKAQHNLQKSPPIFVRPASCHTDPTHAFCNYHSHPGEGNVTLAQRTMLQCIYCPGEAAASPSS